MRRSLSKSLTTLLATAGLICAGLAPVQASEPTPDLISGGKPPASWIVNPDAYYSMFPTLTLDAPQGTVIADSGFRPYPHGFPIPNWGSNESFVQSHLVYGLPGRLSFDAYKTGEVPGPGPMNALSMRRTFGDGVCRDPKQIDPKTGDCELIFGAELLAQLVSASSQGGHCFGLAAAAAALYNGQLPANQVGASGVGINATNEMRRPATQTIERLYGTQYFNPQMMQRVVEGMSPTELVQTLIRELPGGTVPYVLGVIGDGGGHAITPFAVTDRGAGIYDIAVYDNNFPLTARAVTVDTNDDSFTYTSALNPAEPGIEWNSTNGSRIGLVSVADTLEQQPCPVCLGPDQGTLVAFSSVAEANGDEFGFMLIDEQGNALSDDLYRSVAPLNPPTDDTLSLPIIFIDPGVKFGVQLLTGDLATKQSMEVYAISNGKAQYVLLDELVNNSSTIFGVGGLDGTLFFSSEPSSPRILQLSDQPGVSFDVNGHPLELPANVNVRQLWNTKTERVTYESDSKRTLRWNIQVGGLDNAGGREYVGRNVPVPAGGRIVVDYTNASTTVSPRAWVRDSDGNRRPITLQPVTEQLVNEYRNELYVSEGPR